MTKLTTSHNVTSLNISLTEQCNFRCDYCYETFTNDIIQDDVLKSTIRFLYESNSKRVEFWMFGGEITTTPLKVLLATRYIVELRKQYDKDDVRIIYFTNGYIYNEELWCKINSILHNSSVSGIIQVSYDGLNGMNYARKNVAKENTDNIVKENIFKFNKHVKVIVRSTIAPSNISDDTSILETAQWLERNNISEYAFNLVQEACWDEEKSSIVIKQVEALANWLKWYYLKNPYRKFVVFPFDTAFNKKDKICGVGSTFMSVNANGMISPCHVLYSHAKITNTQDNELWGYIGDVSNGLDNNKAEKFINLNNNIKPCISCPSMICNVCPAVSAKLYNDIKYTKRDGYCSLMLSLQDIVNDFKKHVLNNCDVINFDSNWHLLFFIWQNIWQKLHVDIDINKIDSISFNTMYISSASDNVALSHFKLSVNNFSKILGYDTNTLENGLSVLSNYFDCCLPTEFSLDNILNFSLNVYNKLGCKNG